MPSRDFYFLRHGETDWNVQKRLQGASDIPLNENGREQARASIPALRTIGLHRIVASPLLRAHATAEIIKEDLGLPLHVDARLRERNYGLYEGQDLADIEILKKAALETGAIEAETGYVCPPGAEEYKLFHARILTAVKETLLNYPKEKILFVTHGGVYRALCRDLLKGTDQSPNARPFHFSLSNEKTWSLKTC